MVALRRGDDVHRRRLQPHRGRRRAGRRVLLRPLRPPVHNLRLWGVVILVIGILQLITCRFIYQRSQAGALLGIAMATVSAFAAFLALGAYPPWAIVILVIDGLVIYGLTRAPAAA